MNRDVCEHFNPLDLDCDKCGRKAKPMPTSHPIPVKARGIPCYAHVHHFEDELDEYGYTYDLDYTLTDARDKPVPWIESKMTPRDWDRIDTQIIEYYDSLIDEYQGE